MAALDLLKVPVATKVRVPSSQQTSKLGSRQILQVKAQRYRDQEGTYERNLYMFELSTDLS